MMKSEANTNDILKLHLWNTDSGVRKSAKNGNKKSPNQAFIYRLARRGGRNTRCSRRRWKTESGIVIGML
jgi:hypothetical protein